MVTLFEAFVLAVFQGLTEWLPVSSSGHLVIIQNILGLNSPLIFVIMLHLGTSIVVIAVFRKDITNTIKALVKGDFKTPEGKFALNIVIGSVPLAIIGIALKDFIESLFSNLLAVSVALIITGCILFISEKRPGNKKMTALDSLLIGIAQAAAIIPGISRSGTTVSTGLLRKIDKTNTFRYSFVLSLPAIMGATIIESKDLIIGNINPIPIVLGVIVSMIVGYASLKLLQKSVMKEKFHLFAYYCWTVGILTVIFIILQ